MPTDLQLRDVRENDLPIFFEQQLDPDANRMAAFTAKDPMDREAFTAHWAKILGDAGITIKTILFEGQVAGHVLSHGWFGEPEISYWLGREYWGRGLTGRWPPRAGERSAQWAVGSSLGRAVSRTAGLDPG